MEATGIVVFWVAVFTVVFYVITIYNKLVRIKHNVTTAWLNIDVLLKQRHDEIPKLIETCKQYLKFEKGTLEKVMQARNQVSQARQSQDIGGLGPAESMIRMDLGNLFAVAETYSDLKANETFKHLKNRIISVESALLDRREFYNESVNIINTQIEQFPDIIIARALSFKKLNILKFCVEEVNVNTIFSE